MFTGMIIESNSGFSNELVLSVSTPHALFSQARRGRQLYARRSLRWQRSKQWLFVSTTQWLVGGFNPFENCWPNWIIPQVGVNKKKIFETTT